MAKGTKTGRPGDLPAPSVVRPRVQRVPGVPCEVGRQEVGDRRRPEVPVPSPSPRAVPAVTPLVGTKKTKKKCCRSLPRCKGCPVVQMRTARLEASGLTGKDLKKAVKRARAA